MNCNWFETTVGEFCSFEYGKGLPQNQRNQHGSIPVYGSSGVVGFHDQYLIEGPGIIIGRKGSIGSIFYSEGPFWPIDTTYYVEVTPSRNLKYTYYLLKSIGLEIMNSDSAVPGLNRNAAHARVIQVPMRITEQRAVAAILGSLDDKIELNRRMNATLEGIARALFKSWFVDFDPVYANRGERASSLPDEMLALFPDTLVESELGMIPAGWRVAPLDKIAHYQNGIAWQRYAAEEGEDYLPVIKIREMRQGFVDENSNRARPNIKPACRVYDGDVLFSWSGSLLVDFWTGGNGALNQHLFKVTSKKYPRWFYYHWTKYHLEQFQSIAAAKATTMGHIKRGDLKRAMVLIPPMSLLEQMTKTIAPLLEKIILNRLESRTLAELRDTLLPRLISGQLRVPEAHL